MSDRPPGHEASGRSGAEWEEQKDERGERMMIWPDSKGSLGIVDAIVFDCDGVLVDVRGSYDASILRTTQTIVKDFAGATLPLEGKGGGGELILQVRRTGGFNSDWDVTYALTLFSVAAMTATGAALSQGDGTGRTIARLKEIVTGFSSRERLAGWREVDAYLEIEGLGSETVEKLRGYLKYPGNPLCSPMTATFDQIYYGGTLYREVYGVEPSVWYERGLIDEEHVLITRPQLDRLMGLLGGERKRMAMATGRPFVAVEHTLRHLLSYFDLDASVFIGDGDINPELRGELEKYRKPSGASLIRAQERFASRTLLYIGDSAEDSLMVKDASASAASAARPNRILFAGIYGTSFNEEEQLSYFTTNRSDLVVKGVDRIPKILEGLRDR